MNMELTKEEATEVLAERWRMEHKKEWIWSYISLGVWIVFAILLTALLDEILNTWVLVGIVIITAVAAYFPCFRFEKRVTKEGKQQLEQVEASK